MVDSWADLGYYAPELIGFGQDGRFDLTCYFKGHKND